MAKEPETTGASLQPIYERLNKIKTHHPLDAETFADWSMEAGDMVTVTRDGQEYRSPVHTSTLVWKGGAPKITVNSTGNEKRDPLTKLERRNFGRGGGGVRVAKKQFTFEATQEHLWYEVMDEDGKVGRLEVTTEKLEHQVYDPMKGGSTLRNTVSGLYHEVYDTDGKYSVLYNTVDGIHHDVYDPGGLQTTLDTHAGAFSVLCTGVTGTGKNAKLTTAAIQAGIDSKVGRSYITLNANNVNISGDAVTITGTTKLNDVMSVLNGAVFISKPMSAKNITLTSGSYIRYDGNGVTLTESAAADLVRNLRITQDGNMYTLQKRVLGDSDWTTVGSFSRAVTSWLVGGGSGRINVTALPQNQMKSVNVSVDGMTSISSNGTYTFRAMYENLDGDDMPTGASKTVNVNVHPNSITMTNARAGRTSSGTDLYYGVLYYWDDDDGSYQPAAHGSQYWYYASSRRSGTNTYYY